MDSELTIEEQNIADDDEFGMAEEVTVDLNEQINHAISSLTDALGRAHWKIGQHAAEIDALKRALSELRTEHQALQENYSQAATRNREQELRLLRDAARRGELNRFDDPQEVDEFLAAAAGRAGLGGGGRSAEATDSTAK